MDNNNNKLYNYIQTDYGLEEFIAQTKAGDALAVLPTNFLHSINNLTNIKYIYPMYYTSTVDSTELTADEMSIDNMLKYLSALKAIQNLSKIPATLPLYEDNLVAENSSVGTSKDMDESVTLEPARPSVGTSKDMDESVTLKPVTPSVGTSKDMDESVTLEPVTPSVGTSKDMDESVTLESSAPSVGTSKDTDASVSVNILTNLLQEFFNQVLNQATTLPELEQTVAVVD